MRNVMRGDRQGAWVEVGWPIRKPKTHRHCHAIQTVIKALRLEELTREMGEDGQR